MQKRITKQKKLLYNEIKTFSSFFDATELHAQIAKRNHNIGLATVYRFLNSLECEGGIHSFVCENRRIYSSNTKNHVHFTCHRCGTFKHIAIKNADFLSEATDDEICHFQIELTGVCSACRENAAKR